MIAQPWFTALGHPAQSLRNTMHSLGHLAGVDYLVAEDGQFGHHADLQQALGSGQRLYRFAVAGSNIRRNTRRCLWGLLRLALQLRDVRFILLFDMDLDTVAKAWPLLAPFLKVDQLSLLHLTGPEQFAPGTAARRRVERLLARRDVVLCLRTDELAQDWTAALAVARPARIRTLPSLEIPEGLDTPARDCDSRADLRLGILGQLRRGKCIHRLVPLFAQRPGLGRLQVAGSFASAAERDALDLLQHHAGFEERYLAEDELLRLTAAQDYVLILYDEWDPRMESAVLYLAMRAHRPVLAFAEGWCERIIRQFGCGLVVARAGADLAAFLAALPLPGSPAYAALLQGVGRFRDAHRADVLLPRFLNGVGFDAGASRAANSG